MRVSLSVICFTLLFCSQVCMCIVSISSRVPRKYDIISSTMAFLMDGL
jgi:hypothetical protein